MDVICCSGMSDLDSMIVKLGIACSDLRLGGFGLIKLFYQSNIWDIDLWSFQHRVEQPRNSEIYTYTWS